MSKKIFTLALLALCLYSCSPETDQPTELYDTGHRSRKAIPDPANPENPYDLTGRTHNELLGLLPIEISSNALESIIAQTEAIAQHSINFQTLTPAGYNTITQQQKLLIRNSDVHSAFENATMSALGIHSLKNFIDFHFSQQYALTDYQTLYRSIVTFEQGVMTLQGLSAEDRRVILITTSIARYAVTLDKGNGKDKDWHLSKNNIVAAAAGALESEAKAVTMSVASGIFHSKSQ